MAEQVSRQNKAIQSGHLTLYIINLSHGNYKRNILKMIKVVKEKVRKLFLVDLEKKITDFEK